jgi:phosphoglycolate phosphatase
MRPPVAHFDAVIFDLDGTLADSLADIGGAMNETLAAHGFPTHALDAYRGFVGEGVELLAQRALPAAERHRAAEFVAIFRGRYQRRIAQDTRPYPGVPELLDALIAQGLKLAVLSNKRDDFTNQLVQKLFSRWPFAEVRGERQGVPRKPHPQAALEIATVLACDPARCVFVGDTAVDVQTARAAGMHAVGVTWGFRPALELSQAGAHAVLEHPAELLALLQRG